MQDFKMSHEEMTAILNAVKNKVIKELYKDGAFKEKLEPDMFQMKYLIILTRKKLFGKRFDDFYLKDDKDKEWSWQLVVTRIERDLADSL